MTGDGIKEIFRPITIASSLHTEEMFYASTREVQLSLKCNLQGDSQRVSALLRGPKLTN